MTTGIVKNKIQPTDANAAKKINDTNDVITQNQEQDSSEINTTNTITRNISANFTISNTNTSIAPTPLIPERVSTAPIILMGFNTDGPAALIRSTTFGPELHSTQQVSRNQSLTTYNQVPANSLALPSVSVPAITEPSIDELFQDISTYRLQELNIVLRDLKLSRVGNKAVLVDRVRSFINSNYNRSNAIKTSICKAIERANRGINFYSERLINQNDGYVPPKPTSNQVPTSKITVDVTAPIIFETEFMSKDISIISQKLFGGYNEKTMTVIINLDEDKISKLLDTNPVTKEKDHFLSICCAKASGLGKPVDVQFPRNATLMFNNSPLSITHYPYGQAVEYFPATVKFETRRAKNVITINWHNDPLVSIHINKSYVLVVKICRRLPKAEVLENIRSTKFFTKEFVINSRKNRPVDDDIIVGAEVVSLKDPITRCRIKTPCRAKTCSHIQCFDGEVYLTLHEENKTKKRECPVCFKVIKLLDLRIDGYFEDILINTDESVETVQVELDGTWAEPQSKIQQQSKSRGNDDENVVFLDGAPPRKKLKSNEREVICISDSDEEHEGVMLRTTDPSFID